MSPVGGVRVRWEGLQSLGEWLYSLWEGLEQTWDNYGPPNLSELYSIHFLFLLLSIHVILLN